MVELESKRYRHLAYLEGGPPDGPPLFLLHGGTMTASSNWGGVLPAFARHFRVVAPDSPGHGGSANPRADLRYDEIAEDMLALAADQSIDHAGFYGFSDGAQIALEVAFQAPRFPTALVLSAVMHKLTPIYYASMVDYVGAEGFAARSWSAEHPEMAADCSLHHADWDSLAPQIWDLWTRAFELTPDQLSRVVAPTLLLSGDRDRFVSLEQTVELLRLLPNAELAVIPGAGHEYDGRFTETALEFLRRKSSGVQSSALTGAT